jgi:hypothetical protein
MSGGEGGGSCLGDLGLMPDSVSAAAHDLNPDEGEVRLLREMRALYALHDLYHRVVDQPVPRYLTDLVATYAPPHERKR